MVDLQNCLSFRCTAKWFRYMVALVVKNPPANADIRDSDLIPGLGRSPAGGVATHSSILAWEIPWTEGAWWATVRGVAKQLDDLLTEQKLYTHTHTYIHIHICMYRCLILWCPLLLLPSVFPSIREGWDGFMASLMQWTWTWANSRSRWRTGKPAVRQFMGGKRGGHAEWLNNNIISVLSHFSQVWFFSGYFFIGYYKILSRVSYAMVGPYWLSLLYIHTHMHIYM